MAKKPDSHACCPPKPTVEDRPLISPKQTAELEKLFKVFSNGTRLRILHALARSGELCVGELADTVGMKAQAVSNQLQFLADRGILASHRDGTSILYRIIDPCVTSLLELGLCLCEDADTRRMSRGVAARRLPFAGSQSTE
jgi:DNA-binding transcriptional ArsR family regulator